MTDRDRSPFADIDSEFDLLLDDDVETPPARGLTGRMRRVDAAGSEARVAVQDRGRGADGGTGSEAMSPNWSRIAAAAFVAMLALGIVWLLVSAFLGSRRDGAMRDYVVAAGDIAAQSTAQGEELQSILDENIASPQRLSRIEKLGKRAGGLVTDARAIDVPEQMTASQDAFILSLEYRRNGVQQLQRALTTSLSAKNSKAAAAASAAVADANARLLASDVIFADTFAVETRSVLEDEGVTEAEIPTSAFVQNPEAASPTAMAKMVTRFASTPAKTAAGKVVVPKDGKIRGGQLEGGSVTVSPSGSSLNRDGLTEIVGGDDVVFEIPFTNQGEVQLTGVPVKIVMRGDSSDPLELTGEIDVVDAGATATARVPLDAVPSFGEDLAMDVTVGPIPGEKIVENNSASYTVRFSLPEG